MLSLKKSNVRIGGSINTRTEKHGDEDVAALDVPFSGLMLTKDELNTVLREENAYDALFDKKASSPDEPFLKHIKPLGLKDKIEGANVSLTHGLNAETALLSDVNLSKLKLDPKVGGLTELSGAIQCTPDLDDGTVELLLAMMNRDVDMTIDVEGFGAQQQDLPLAPSAGVEQAVAH